MIFRLYKSIRIKSKRDFQKVSKGRRIAGKYLILDFIASNTTKLGLTVSRHYGKSHERNRFKRLVRESFRLFYHQIDSSVLINVRPRAYAKNASLKEIQSELIQLLELKNL